MSITVRAKSSDPMSLAAAVRATVREIDKELPVYQVRSMKSRVYDSLQRRRFSMTLLTVLSVLAMILAAVGIFSVMSFLIAQRTHEIGIRMALGAQPRDVLRLIVGQGMKLGLIGIILGLALSIALTRFMKGLLYQVEATDAQTFVAVSLILAGVALAACLIPARRALRVDPIRALRCEN